MSDAIRDFFRRHHAVPANAAGPSWSLASDDALLEWYAAHRSVVDYGWHTTPTEDWWRNFVREATPAEREAMRSAYAEIRAEILSRDRRPGASPAIFAAAAGIHHRKAD